ncbi:MAG: helix-turn-helix domain-containing protein, partial [Anaerolineae bacterium]|nr:helix-turn-helix domain-containing protein [Anaerolineae bacterium]
MNTQTYFQQALDYQRVAEAIRYLEENFQQQPTLDEIAASVHLSKHHFQRLFKQWAGISPTQFMQYLTLGYAKERLAASHSLLETTLDAGLSSPGRLHDLFVNFEAVTPGEYKQGGTGLEISYGFQPTPFGICLLATTERGICALRFVDSGQETAVLANLQSEWPKARWL